MPEQPRENRIRGGVAAALVVALVIVVYGGYGGHWSWTGINGRTASLWDWLHLLLLPLLVPTIIVPALKPVALSRVETVGKSSEAQDAQTGVG